MSLGPVGLGPVGLGPVGLGPVGFGPVGFGPVGFGPVGIGPVGFGPVGLGSVGFGPVAFGPVGFGLLEPLRARHEPRLPVSLSAQVNQNIAGESGSFFGIGLKVLLLKVKTCPERTSLSLSLTGSDVCRWGDDLRYNS